MDKILASSRTKSRPSGRIPTESSVATDESSQPKHPFENSKDLLVVLPNDVIDVEEEARLYDELCAATQPVSPDHPIFSNRLAEYFAPSF